ncbi:2-hydroxyacid dehydrogenase [Stella sp.]|uniref:2-hydroxyacid dehydrogenase n=1 Tax=Stella sp. TaxID=2912054 RepID=UPI0035B12FEA
MALVIVSRVHPSSDVWAPEMRRLMPEIDIRYWPDVGNPDEVEAVLMWQAPEGLFQRLPKLKAIFATGAGVDAILGDPTVPKHLPLARLVDPSMTAEMSEYVVLQVLRFHRQEPTYAAQQRDRVWKVHPQPHPEQRRVGVMGLGELGQDALHKLAPFGFALGGWSRTPKALAGVETFSGADGFTRFLARTDILVNLLPLTAETENIVDARLLAGLPEGAFLVNCARGRHVVDADLLAALDSGRLAGAALDVFRQEPLPADHPFWSHPKVILTPHAAALTNPLTATPQIVDNLRRVQAGRPLVNLVDRTRGY